MKVEKISRYHFFRQKHRQNLDITKINVQSGFISMKTIDSSLQIPEKTRKERKRETMEIAHHV